MSKRVCAYSPATVANLSVGFDCLGLALESIGDKVEVRYNNSSENRITEIVNGHGLPVAIEKNCSSVVIAKMQETLKEPAGVDIRILKGFESGSGMGSSSASSAAAAVAFNELVGKPFGTTRLISFAAEGERAASGSAHADNVAPAILGGIVLVRDHLESDIVQLPVPEGLHAVMLYPKVRLNTMDSREILMKQVPLPIAAKQWANLGSFVAALYTSDMQLLSRSMADYIAEPARSILIPRFRELKLAALSSGALAFGISGSGPTVFALTGDAQIAQIVKQAMENTYSGTGIETMCFVEKIAGNPGTRVCETF